MDRGGVMRKGSVALALACVVLTSCARRQEAEQQVAASTVDSTEVVLLAPGGNLHVGGQDVSVTVYTGTARAPLAADSVKVLLSTNGPPRETAEARLARVAPGRYAGRVDVPSAGEWVGDVIFNGPVGTASIRVRPAMSVTH